MRMSEFDTIAVMSFTAVGDSLARRIADLLAPFYCVSVSSKHKNSMNAYEASSVTEWSGRQFLAHHAILFIGAMGIAVRAIAPHLRGKLVDSPVLVVDELGQYVIPVLSGHVGGANQLAQQLAQCLHAVPIITTATDLHKLFAVDNFAKKNNLRMFPKEGIASVSSKVLAGQQVQLSSERTIAGNIPEEVTVVDYPPRQKVEILISPRLGEADIQLIPVCIVVGIGCKRGKTRQELEEVVTMQLKANGLDWQSVYKLASIDRKADEAGILELAQKYRIPFETFSAEQLRQTEGTFVHSAFVEAQVGVDNVCARAAMAACLDTGKLLADKFAKEGITVALAERYWNVSW